MKDILKGVPTMYIGGAVEITDPSIKSVRKDISTEALKFVQYCGKRGYLANVAATPKDFKEKLENGQDVENVVTAAGNAASIVYLITRQLKSATNGPFKLTPEDMIGITAYLGVEVLSEYKDAAKKYAVGILEEMGYEVKLSRKKERKND